MKNLIKTGFGLGVGLIGAQMIFLLLGAVFFFWGLLEREKARKNGTSLTMPYALMILGMVLGLGLGFGIVAEGLTNNF
jgi:high-affinity Fe2+/Pb2+ permease